MTRVDRWRNWRPSAKKFGDTAKKELTKLTEDGSVSFVSPVSANAPNFLPVPENPGPAAWAEDFHRWMLERCTFQIRKFGNIEFLYSDFSVWSQAHERQPASPSVFVQLLTDAGLFQANGLVNGLILHRELRTESPTDQSRTASRTGAKNDNTSH